MIIHDFRKAEPLHLDELSNTDIGTLFMPPREGNLRALVYMGQMVGYKPEKGYTKLHCFFCLNRIQYGDLLAMDELKPELISEENGYVIIEDTPEYYVTDKNYEYKDMGILYANESAENLLQYQQKLQNNFWKCLQAERTKL